MYVGLGLEGDAGDAAAPLARQIAQGARAATKFDLGTVFRFSAIIRPLLSPTF